ncbi:hypothetical protein [Candidatus Frankia alpina]|uniref:Uncharacterized protein n=1 Tax=Candidatus Frankia alpina TaxID=2699483 RepID=A0A4S5ESK9_9ACTN|nr:hypothetical protein [Candidatus Frankia alpina]THJ75386.1 hypothetical protein E7Y31_05825 [Candidatus Frankia alpina]
MGRTQTLARAPRPWVERVKARHARRRALYDREMARARRPTDQLGVATDYLRGALRDAPPAAAGREVDLLIRAVREAVVRLHEAELRAQP